MAPPNIPTLKLLSLLACRTMQGVPFDMTVAGSPLLAEKDRFESLYTAELSHMERVASVQHLEEYASLDEMIEEEGLREYYSRLAFLRRMKQDYARSSAGIANHRRHARLIDVLQVYKEIEHTRLANLDVPSILQRVDDLVSHLTDADTYEAVCTSTNRLCEDYSGFVRRVGDAAVAAFGYNACLGNAWVGSMFWKYGYSAPDDSNLWDMRCELIQECPTPAMIAVLLAPELKWVPTQYFLPPGSLRDDVAAAESVLGTPDSEDAPDWSQMACLAVLQLVGRVP
jgi:hypothetical protein